jgi:hypothetical protein
MAKQSSTASNRRPPAKKKATNKKAASTTRRPAATKAKQKPVIPKKRFRFHQPVKHPPLPSVVSLTARSVHIFWQHRRLFTGITLTYALLNFVLVQGLSVGVTSGSIKVAFATFANLISTSATVSGPYQFILATITSLAVIWALRCVLSDKPKPSVRDAFYRGMYPLIPFVLVLIVMFLQLLPLALGARLYSAVITDGFASHGIENALCLIIFIALALWSLYMLTASFFALYIVTLPGLTPLPALRSARDLVRSRRWLVLRKILGFPLILFCIGVIIMIPIIIVVPSLAPFIFFLLIMIALVALHLYMYTFYRTLLHE